MSEPKYRSYKPIHKTDGLLSWVEHSFDNAVEMTPDDIAKLISITYSMAPNARITNIQAKIKALAPESITDVMKLHIQAIESIYGSLDNHFSVDFDGLAKLEKAEDLWYKVVLLRDMIPKAVMGAKASKTQSARAKVPRKLTASEQQRIAEVYEQRQREGSVYGVVQALAGQYNVSEKTISRIALKRRSEK